MTTAPQILFVDDEATAVKYFQRAIEPFAAVITASSVAEGQRMLDQHASSLSVLVSDQRMPGAYGNELLHYARAHYPNIVRVLTTAYSELDNTIEAVNQGQIHRYIRKPWDIDTLRMEMRQALELAALRKEHAELMREKMLVRQTQMVSNRIGALHALCACLAGPGSPSPVETYLAAALAAGGTAPQPDWLRMDYADLVSAEAFRNGQFGHAVRTRLAELRQQQAATPGDAALALLAQILAGQAQLAADTLLLGDSQHLAEFLTAPCDEPVSARHASWLACLIWLHDQGQSLQLTPQGSGLQLRLVPAAAALTQERLAAWIEKVGDAQK